MGTEEAKGGDNPKARTLRRAVEVVGSEEALADTLGVSYESVSAWLLGEQPLPNDLYMRALDLVSQGPHHQPRRKPK
ncbi:MAG TPA: YdaS family helix-turn-helix protein [Burkholderiales bacterium]|nr:YdaS family helix-turn-helix protein [Burkholderiales bacterium]